MYIGKCNATVGRPQGLCCRLGSWEAWINKLLRSKSGERPAEIKFRVTSGFLRLLFRCHAKLSIEILSNPKIQSAEDDLDEELQRQLSTFHTKAPPEGLPKSLDRRQASCRRCSTARFHKSPPYHCCKAFSLVQTMQSACEKLLLNAILTG